MNDAAAAGHVCPGMRIHAIDIVHPPGIGMPPMADIDAHQAIEPAVLTMKSSASTPENARSALLVFVMAPEPEAGFIAAQRRAIEPLVHAPQSVEPARVRGVGVIDGAVLAHERAHARPLAHVRGHVGPRHRGELRRTLAVAGDPALLAPEVV